MTYQTCKCATCSRQYVVWLREEKDLDEAECPSCGEKTLIKVSPGFLDNIGIFGGSGGG